jgi:ABC-2 type transport system ATP-binding protein
VTESVTERSPASAGPPAIVTEGLTRTFGKLLAVDALDLVVAAGRVFGLHGPNGAGKSTTIKMLTTLLPPTAGAARVAGFDVVREAVRVRASIGYVPQLVSADGGLTARENLAFSAKLYGVPRAERGPRIDEALARMGLVTAADALVKTYSGGMVRRLEIAQALLHRPQVLFLDEPTVGLDPVARRAVWELLRGLQREGRVTILLTTHDMEEADHLCDEVAIMHQGRVAVVGAPAALRAAIGPAATLDDVFARHSGGAIEAGGRFADVRHTRSTASRLG